MAAKVWYPLFLDIEGRRVVIAGGGKVALRKAQGLAEAGARITAVAPRFDAGFEGLPVERIERAFQESDTVGAMLVFAATDSRDVNHRIAELAKERGIPANIADAPEECGFIVPARIRRGDVQIAVSTGGTDPSRAASLRRKLEEWLDLMRP
jgi:precorrin-2 dehydrogenase/sirohydrochlorin ferrochelatase